MSDYKSIEEIEMDLEKEEMFESKKDLGPESKSIFELVVDSADAEEPQALPAEVVSEFDKALEEDFTLARDNMIHLAKEGKKSLNYMLMLAKASDHPRAFEVVATMLKTLSDINKDLLDLHGKRQKAMEKPAESANQNNTQNNIFLGSTAELQKLLEDSSL